MFTISHENLPFQNIEQYVQNVTTNMQMLLIDDNRWFITVNETEYDNALICSPYTTYVTYPLDELKQFPQWWKKILIVVNTGVMFFLCRLSKFNRVVQVNNCLNSLIRHPQIFATRLTEVTQYLCEQYPHHAINFFRVNKVLDSELVEALQKNNYIVFPDRVAHLFFPDDRVMKCSHTKRDLALLKKSSYTIVEHDALTEADAARIADLYSQLFLEKYSKRNPAYTVEYFKKALRERMHTYVALKNKAGVIDAFISWFVDGEVMTCGPLGYDHTVAQEAGLYRQLVAICLQHAHTHRYIFNMGAGSDLFKRNRGSTSVLEYTAVYCAHLPKYRHIPWKILSFACNRLLEKIIN